ncbi:hypothetical protein KR018_005598, partial [Drosophila ironensis]
FKSSLLLVVVLLAVHLDASKIAYKKPLYGKSNHIKEKRLKSKPIKLEATTIGPTEESVEFVIVTTPKASMEIRTTTELDGTTKAEESSTDFADSMTTLSGSSSELATTTTQSSSLTNTIPSPPTPEAETAQDSQPVPCTCGVFLSSQIPNGLPTSPLIHQELDRMFPCNAIGRKQCQTKCLEAIVQHLPNSANIVCSALGHDCHKERAYLFIKNCQNQWINTNLQAGREYCCRNGVPYRCPLMG